MHSVGELGEQLVALWLEFQGYKILHQRWRCRWGEIDLIAQAKLSPSLSVPQSSVANLSENRIIFVEVKTRSGQNWDEDGSLAVNWQKQAKIIQTASLFLAQNPHLADFPCRFDVALVGYQRLDYSEQMLLAQNNRECQLDKEQPSLRDRQDRVLLKNYFKSAFDL